MPPVVRSLLWVSISFIGVCGARTALAQQDDPGQNQARQGVYLNDSFAVRQELRVIKRLVDAGEWSQAALTVHNLAARHADQIVKVQEDLYTSVPLHLDQLVSRWPPIGLSAYRRLYEEEANTLLETARAHRDRESLLEVVRRYFCTTAAGQAGMQIAQLRLEAGRFDAAASMLDRLLRMHPDFADGPPEALALHLASLSWAGRKTDAHALAERILSEHADETVRWLGRPRPLVEVVDAVLDEEIEALRDDDAPFLWVALGGNPARNRVIRSCATVGAAVWSYDLTADLGRSETPVESVAAAQSATRGRYLDMFPAVQGKRVFFHDAFRVLALDLDTGNTLWRYELPDLSDRNDVGRSESGPPGLYAPALWRDRVFAALGAHDVPYYGYPAAVSQAVLVCLESETGQPLWKADGKHLSPPFTTIQFDGAPVCADDRVLLVARRRKTFGFEDCLLMCFETETGRLAWQTHLGSASAGGYGYRKPTVSAPAVHGDTVYVQSNLGTLAAVDLYSGLLRWLRVYPSLESMAPGWATQVSPWQYNPTTIWNDRVVFAPLDFDKVLVLDSDTGKTQAEIAQADLGHFQTILGIHENRLYFVGERFGAWDLSANRLAWSESLPDPGPFGRGTVVADGLFVPTVGCLMQYDLQGRLVERAPWSPMQARGNVVATPDELIVASSHRVTCYARKEEVFARLRRRMERSPAEPEPCLDLAEMAFRTGDAQLGIRVFRQGIERAGNIFEIRDAELKKRIFDDCLSFARRLLDESDSNDSEALRLYELAAECPPDAESAVLYRLELAGLHERMERYTDAIGVYRQVMTDRSLHEVEYDAAVPGGTEAGRTQRCAGQAAAHRIASIIQRHGRAAYAPFDKQALDLLHKGLSLGQPALLKRVADLYPNSESAPRALVALGDLYAQRGQYRLAARNYKTAKNLYADRVDLPALYASIVNCYAQSGRTRTAAAWLRAAAGRFPRRLIEVDGRKVRFAQWYQRNFSQVDVVVPPLPRVAPPLLQASTRRFGAEVTVLKPRFSDEPGTRSDVYLAYFNGKLMLFDPVHDRPFWSEPTPCRSEPTLLVFAREQEQRGAGTSARQAGDGPLPESRLVLATRHEVFALSPETGERLWTFGKYPSDLDDTNADHESFANFNNLALFDFRLVCTQARGLATALDIHTGKKIWEVTLAHHVLDEPAALNDEFFLYHSMSGDRHVYPLLDAETGRLMHTFEMPDRVGPPLLVSLLPEGIALIVTAETIWAYDAVSGKLLWNAEESRRIAAATVQIGLDGIYLSQDRRRMVKRSLYHDRVLWTSPSLDVDGGAYDTLAASLQGDALYVLGEDMVMALDPVDGRILWEGATGIDLQFIEHLVAADFIVGIDLQEDETRTYTAYFYDRRGGSGRIPKNGGVVELGEFDHLRHVALLDHCLIVVDGQTVYTWIEESAWPK